MALFSKKLKPTLAEAAYHNSTFRDTSLHLSTEHIPVHSPLLRAAFLVSSPPLTYMLKFSGIASLTPCYEGSTLYVRAPRLLAHSPRLCGKPLVRQRQVDRKHLVDAHSGAHGRTCTYSHNAHPGTHKNAHLQQPSQLPPVDPSCGWRHQRRPTLRHALRAEAHIQNSACSRNFAGRSGFRASQRPSSMPKPRHPSLKVDRH